MSSLNKTVRRTLLKLGSAASLNDGQLLLRFATSQEQAAFEELVRRHGPMVLRVCQRVLHHAQDAEDAFQASFIVLMRKASSVAKQESVASWLHGVAYRVALKARTTASQRHGRERPGSDTVFDDQHPAQAAGGPTWQDLCPVLDEELHRLPEKYRAAIVLCYFEAKTNEEAARLLGCPAGTIRARLSRGREMLRSRLARRGLNITAAALASVLAQQTVSAAVRASLLTPLVQAATLLAAGKAVAPSAVSAPVALLADATLKGMAAFKTRFAASMLLGALVLGGSWAAFHSGISPVPRSAQLAGAVVVGQKSSNAGPLTLTILQYESGAAGAKTYGISTKLSDNAPIKEYVVTFNGRPGVRYTGKTAFNAPPGTTFGVLSASEPTLQLAPGTIVALRVADDRGREASVSYTIKSWP
jgi:RNA polymerase sigma factor (sigma-70 family)